MDHAAYRFIRFCAEGGVLTVTLNRPEAMNAINAGLHTELSKVFGDIAADPSVHAVVLTGAGKGFCGGGDLSWFRDITRPEVDTLFEEARKIVVDLLEVRQPIVAAVNGHAAGLGATLALLCDVVYMADTARLSDPHVRVGVAAGDGGAAIWPLLVGPARAKEYLMTGDSLAAAEAQRIGLVNHVVAAQDVLARATEMARRFADGPRRAVQATKASVNKLVRDAVNLVLDTSLALEKANFFDEDHKEAIAAFAERRPPRFVGR
jgi:enoyl-CoA hydratase